MSAFVNQLRSRGEPLRISPEGVTAITVRVEMPEVWDVVKVIVSPDEPVLAVKVRALEALFPRAEFPDDFVLKLNGWEVLNETASVAATGAVEGSTYLLLHRLRRPVR